MKFICTTVLFLMLLSTCENALAQSRPTIIFDTDIGPDYDDVGALTLLHAYEDAGQCKILATIASNRPKSIAAVLDVINTYFKKPDIPIGVVRGEALQLSAWQKWDSVIVERYDHDIKRNEDAWAANQLYRKLLSEQPDHSVTIVTVGFMTNMANLLKSKPDHYSKLNGRDLVARKVRQLVSMAGRFPEGKEFNIEKDSKASMYVAEKWPGEIIFTGWEIGARIFSGLPLIESAQMNSPVKDVFSISIPMSKEDVNGRKSWDQTAVVIAVEGAARYYELVPGKIICNKDGSNAWDANARGHFYVKEKTPAADMATLINSLMLHRPGQ